ncbi:MAG: ATP-binding cassette domain-containing protein [Anaerolineales bacterium]|nr:ATP-binding cassette domain-containing protein [Anaerolineales bacterium]
MTTLRFDDATIGYDARVVLREVSLGVTSGEILGVVGPNGVGKSTLVKAASGVLFPIEGQVLIDKQSLSELSAAERARSLAVVPQAAHLPGAYCALDVVLMGRTPFLSWLGREGKTDYEIAFKAMRRTGISHLAGRPVGELSGGEQQRVLIAQALAQTPSVLLLDEPTAHLDLKHQDEVLQLIRSLATEGDLAVLLTLHDLNLVARFTDRVALLSDGRVRKEGLPSEVLTADELAAVYGITIQVTDHPIHGTPLVLS